MPSNIKLLTRIAHDWAVRCFGIEHVTNLPVRALRTLEETAELAQALGLSREQAHLCIDRVYDRPAGDPNQEVGGVMVTLNVLCESMRVDSEALFEQEVRRILKKSPDHFAKRNQVKIDMGLDAGAQQSGDPIPRRSDGTPIGDGGPMER